MTEVVAEPGVDEGSCTKEGCPANEGGECAIGEENILDCEFYELSELDEPAAGEPTARTVRLPEGEALRSDELELVTADKPVSMVVPLGLVKAGKTTLICLIFDQVRTGRVPGWSFTKSKTVLGFARRSHYASFASGRDTPTTPRTPQLASGLHLHLGMRAEDGSETPVVFADLSGEHVAPFVDGKVDPVVSKALRRADHIPVLVNGGDIADPDSRNLAIYEARALLGMIAEQDLPEHASVSVVLTKGDLLGDVDTESVFDDITRGTIAEQAPRFVTADRPSPVNGEIPAVERGHGVSALLAHIATRPTPAHAVLWPAAPALAPSVLLRRRWGMT